MPVTWEFRASVLVIVLTGHYEFDEQTSAVEAAMRDSRYTRDTPILFDARSSLTYMSPMEVGRRAAWFEGMRRQGHFPRCAFVVADDPLRQRIASLGTAAFRRFGVEPRVFRDRDAALRWLVEATHERQLKAHAVAGPMPVTPSVRPDQTASR